MSASWRVTESGIFEIVDRQGLVAKIFGCFMLSIACFFLYWLGTAVVEYVRFGTLHDVLVALPGMAVTLFMAALFGVPGILMGFLKKQTLCNKASGLVQHVKSLVVFRLKRQISFSDVKLVAATYRTTKKSITKNSLRSAPVHTVEMILVDKHKLEVAQLGNWTSAVTLGRQLAGYLGVEFQEGPA